MNCEEAAYRISCELANLTTTVNQPSGWEVAGVIVAALTAIGTTGLAIANLVLIRRQHVLQISEVEREARVRRELFVLEINRWLTTQTSNMSSKFYGGEKRDDREIRDSMGRMALETGEEEATTFLGYVTSRMDLKTPHATSPVEVASLGIELGFLAKKWANKPASVVRTYQDAFDEDNATREKPDAT